MDDETRGIINGLTDAQGVLLDLIVLQRDKIQAIEKRLRELECESETARLEHERKVRSVLE